MDHDQLWRIIITYIVARILRWLEQNGGGG